MEGITFAALLTAAGAGIAAGIVTGFVDVVKASLPVAKDWHGAGMAFGASAVLYVLAGIATNAASLDAGLEVFLAWLTCASAAVGLHKVVVKPLAAKVKG